MDCLHQLARWPALCAIALLFLIAGCAERPRIGITITNAPTIPDCIQGSATKPCD